MMNQWRGLCAVELRFPTSRGNEVLWGHGDGTTIMWGATLDRRVQETVRPMKMNNYLRVRVGEGMSTGERIK